MTEDFHDAFDDATILKLDIFRHYIKEWLGVFLSTSTHKEIYLVDFFAGPGTDSNGILGSPSIIIDEVQNYIKSGVAYANNVIHILLNEYAPAKYDLLKQSIPAKLHSNIQVEIENLDFNDAFAKWHSVIRENPALIFIDQFGVKFMSEDIFKVITKFKYSDIIFFISSSHLKRFAQTSEFAKYFPSLNVAEIKKISSQRLHTHLCKNYYAHMVEQKRYFLAPFSIQKPNSPNIYGLIFCTGHILGLDKFLSIAWKKDTFNGEANYIFAEDQVYTPEDLFPATCNQLSKLMDYEAELIKSIGTAEKTNKEVYEFSLLYGLSPSKAAEIVKKMIKDHKLACCDYESKKKCGNVYINYDNYRDSAPIKVIFTCIDHQKLNGQNLPGIQ